MNFDTFRGHVPPPSRSLPLSFLSLSDTHIHSDQDRPPERSLDDFSEPFFRLVFSLPRSQTRLCRSKNKIPPVKLSALRIIQCFQPGGQSKVGEREGERRSPGTPTLARPELFKTALEMSDCFKLLQNAHTHTRQREKMQSRSTGAYLQLTFEWKS